MTDKITITDLVGHLERARQDTERLLSETIAERDAAIARAEKAEAAIDEAEEELGAIKEAITQHLPRYVNENDEDDECDAVETIEEAGRELARKSADKVVSAGTYAKRCDERDEARKAHAAAERARDEVGIQLAAAQAEIARLRPVVEAARDTITTPMGEMLPALNAIYRAIQALDTVPGDALAPRLPGVQNEMWRMANARIAELEGLLRDAQSELRLCREKDGAGPYDPTLKVRITAALEASGIDASNVKGVE